MKTLNFLFVALIILSATVACNKDDDNCGSTYSADVKAIIDRSCAYSGCHSGADAGMFVSDVSKDYTNYAGLQATLMSGAFSTRVLDSLDMPPFYTPDGNPKELTQQELDIISCWIDAGYPES